MPKISVITTTYNRAHLIGEAIESVLNQTFTDFELIIVDDGSTDKTEEVVRSFSDTRLKYIRQINKGLPGARNTGIKAASGEFIGFLDDDDLFLPNKLSLQISKLEDDTEAGLVYGLYFSAKGIATNAPKIPKGTCDPPMGLSRLLLGSWPHISTILVRHLWVNRIGGFDEQLRMGGDDVDFYLRLALAECGMSCLPWPLTIVRQQPGSIGKSTHHSDESSFAVLDKVFRDSRLPAELRDLRNLAYAKQLVRIAASAYASSQLEIGRNILQRALAMEPNLAKENINELVNLLVYRIRGLSFNDPEEVLQHVTQYLPGDKAFAKQLRRQLWGKFYEVAAFEAYQLGQPSTSRAYALRAIGKTPSCLRNRGLLSLLVRSLIPPKFMVKIPGPN